MTCDDRRVVTTKAYLAVVAYSSRKGREAAYALVRRWIEQCLVTDGSLLTEGRRIWTLANLQDLKARFVDVPVEGASSFEDKLRHQLQGAADDVKQLAAEVLCAHYAVPADISRNKKMEVVGNVLAWMETPVVVPDDVAAAFRIGLINAGQGYRQFKPNQLWFLIEAALAIKQASPDERRRLLHDPWALKAMLAELPIRSAFITSNMLLHMLHPETFEPIGGREHKKAIVAALGRSHHRGGRGSRHRRDPERAGEGPRQAVRLLPAGDPSAVAPR